MNYYLYRIENLLNGKFYIGRRQCSVDVEKDDYWGSGKLIQSAIEKYGLKNFRKTILAICPNAKYLDDLEEQYVDQSLVDNPK